MLQASQTPSMQPTSHPSQTRSTNIIVEVGFGQADDVKNIASACGFRQTSLVKDLQGISRILVFQALNMADANNDESSHSDNKTPKKNAISGWLIIDKPTGMTSARVGNIVRRACNVRKLGHVGTLDPMATGLLVMAIGEATKLIPYIPGAPMIVEADRKCVSDPKTCNHLGIGYIPGAPMNKGCEQEREPGLNPQHGDEQEGPDSNRDEYEEVPCHTPKKEYEFDIQFGQATDTYDADGKVTETCDVLPTELALLDICKAMVGPQDQVPPTYSAIKSHGRRLCDLARKGEVVTPQARRVHIYSLEMVAVYTGESSECKYSDVGAQNECEYSKGTREPSSVVAKARFRATVSGGTYIRSLANDIAKKANSCGHVTHLRRLKDGMFDISQAISLEKFLDLAHKGYIGSCIVPIGAVLGDIPAVSVSEQEWKWVLCGRAFDVTAALTEGLVRILYDDALIGLGNIVDGVCFPRRVFSPLL
jgi:tRNA pseudouridine55 synthase